MIERIISDVCDAVGNNKTSAHSCDIFNERRLVLVEQCSVKAAINAVLWVNCKVGQTGAANESRNSNGIHTLGKRDAGQIGAITERIAVDAFGAIP